MKRLLILTTVCFLFCCKVFSQSPVNRPYKNLNEKLDALSSYCDSLLNESASDSAEKVANYAISITPKTDVKHLAEFYGYLGGACEATTLPDSVCISRYNTAQYYAKKAGDLMPIVDNLGSLLSLYESLQTDYGYNKRDSIYLELKRIKDTEKNKIVLVKVLGYTENYYSILGKKDTAVNYALQGLELAKKLYAEQQVGNNFVANSIYRVIRAFINNGNHEKKLQYVLDMRNYIVNNNSMLAAVYMYAAQDYIYLKQPSKALVYYDSLNMLANKVNNALVWNNALEASLYFGQAFASKKYDDPGKAYEYAKRAFEINEKWGYGFYTANISYTMGNALLSLKKYQEALPYLHKGAVFAKSQYGELYQACLRKLSLAYAGAGNLPMAYNYLDTASNVQDSLSKIVSDKAFADAEAQYQTKEKQQQIEIKNVALEAGKKQRVWLIVGIALLLVVAVLLVVIYSNKRKSAAVLAEKNDILARLIQQLEEANQTKARLFSIISHDLRSPINQVYQFLKLQQLNPGMLTESQRAELSNKIQTATGSLLETMEDLLIWSKTQMNQFNIEMQNTYVNNIAQQCISLLHLNSVSKNIQVVNKLPENLQVYSDPYFLQTILRNLLQNAIKACPAGETVIIGYEAIDNRYMLYIQNPGPVFTQAEYEELLATKETGKSLTGLGLRLVDELSRKTGIKVQYTQTADNQTQVQLFIQA